MIFVEFTAKSECIVEYYLPKFVLYGLEGDNAPSSYEDWNDHVFRVDQYHNLKICGHIVFETNPADFDGNIKKMKEWSEILDATEFSIQINKVSSEESALLRAIRS